MVLFLSSSFRCIVKEEQVPPDPASPQAGGGHVMDLFYYYYYYIIIPLSFYIMESSLIATVLYCLSEELSLQ